jgi:hypothetical protein
MQYITASSQASSKMLRSLPDKFSLGSTARSPQGGFMKRNLIGTLSLVALSLLLTAAGAAAQSAVQANIPFGFRVGTAQLPAGTYRIKAAGQSLIMASNGETMKSVYSGAQPEGPSRTSAKLVFHHLGNQYFLAEVWGDAGDQGMTLPASKLERELQIAQGPANHEEDVVLLSAK